MKSQLNETRLYTGYKIKYEVQIIFVDDIFACGFFNNLINLFFFPVVLQLSNGYFITKLNFY